MLDAQILANMVAILSGNPNPNLSHYLPQQQSGRAAY
jgi:hypothetical protein